MSKNSNVNPDHYKIAGRGRQGENVVPELEKQRLAREQEAAERRRRDRLPASDENEPADDADKSAPRPGKARE
jgi:hypothetical protein